MHFDKLFVYNYSFHRLTRIYPKINQFMILLFAVVSFFSLLKISQPMIAEPDAYDRINIAIKNFDLQIFFDDHVETWLPLHSTFLIIAALPLNDFLYSPRFATLALSLASTYFIFLISKEYTDTKDQKKWLISFLSFSFALIFPLRFFLSDHTLSEHPFIFFFLGAYFYLIKDKPNLILSAIIFNFAHALRYESWLFLPWFIGHLLIAKNSPKEKIVSFFVFFAFPTYWIWQSYIQTSNLFHFFAVKQGLADLTESVQKNNLWLSLRDWTIRLKETFSWFGITLVIFTTLKMSLNKPSFKLILIWSFPIFLFVSLIYQSFSGSMEWLPHRYLLFPCLLAMPILALGLIKIKRNISIPIFVVICLLLAISYKNMFIQAKNYSQSNMYFLKTSFFDLDEQIEINNLDRQSIIYLHNSEYNQRLWLEGPFYYFNRSTKTDRVATNDFQKVDQLIKTKEYNFVIEKSSINEEILQKIIVIYENDKFVLASSK